MNCWSAMVSQIPRVVLMEHGGFFLRLVSTTWELSGYLHDCGKPTNPQELDDFGENPQITWMMILGYPPFMETPICCDHLETLPDFLPKNPKKPRRSHVPQLQVGENAAKIRWERRNFSAEELGILSIPHFPKHFPTIFGKIRVCWGQSSWFEDFREVLVYLKEFERASTRLFESTGLKPHSVVKWVLWRCIHSQRNVGGEPTVFLDFNPPYFFWWMQPW